MTKKEFDPPPVPRNSKALVARLKVRLDEAIECGKATEAQIFVNIMKQISTMRWLDDRTLEEEQKETDDEIGCELVEAEAFMARLFAYQSALEAAGISAELAAVAAHAASLVGGKGWGHTGGRKNSFWPPNNLDARHEGDAAHLHPILAQAQNLYQAPTPPNLIPDPDAEKSAPKPAIIMEAPIRAASRTPSAFEQKHRTGLPSPIMIEKISADAEVVGQFPHLQESARCRLLDPDDTSRSGSALHLKNLKGKRRKPKRVRPR